MSSHLLASLSALLLCLGLCHSLPVVPKNKVVLDAPEGNSVVLSWVVARDEVTFDLDVKALGYVAIGISRSGGMNDSDIAVGWVTNDGETILQDRFAVDRSVPRIDNNNDLNLISSKQTATNTRLVFSRKLDTGDLLDDVAIPTGDVYVIWAYTDVDPVDAVNIPYHETKRGVKTIRLRP